MKRSSKTMKQIEAVTKGRAMVLPRGTGPPLSLTSQCPVAWFPVGSKPIHLSWLQQLQALRLGCPTEFLPALPNCVGSWRGHLELQGLPKRTPKNSRRTGTPLSSASPCCTNICSRCESQESSASSITWRNSHGQFSPDYKKLEYETLISELDMAKILSRWLCLTSHLQWIS